jgi:hypothetical protein
MSRYKTRDPAPKIRDPVPNIPTLPPCPPPKEWKARRYIPASAPCVCPDCGHSTRMDNGRHIDPVRRTILEYRTCSKCGAKLAAGRPMVAHEIESLCGRASAVAEYETTLRQT